MKARNYAKMGFQVGVCVGTVLFLLIGLLPSLYLAGFYGSKISQYLFGGAQGLVVGLSMVFGVAVAGLLYLTSFGVMGWLGGRAIAMARAPRTERVPARAARPQTADDLPREVKLAVEHGK